MYSIKNISFRNKVKKLNWPFPRTFFVGTLTNSPRLKSGAFPPPFLGAGAPGFSHGEEAPQQLFCYKHIRLTFE